MWISRKQYNFLKENAEKNIDAECEILRAKEKQDKTIARAAEEYSAVLKENNKLKQELNEWKQKYADEFQKRLEVIEYIDCIRKMP